MPRLIAHFGDVKVFFLLIYLIFRISVNYQFLSAYVYSCRSQRLLQGYCIPLVLMVKLIGNHISSFFSTCFYLYILFVCNCAENGSVFVFGEPVIDTFVISYTIRIMQTITSHFDVIQLFWL